MNKVIITNVVYTVVLLLIVRSIYRIKMNEKKSLYFELKLKILKQDYLEVRQSGNFKEYPFIEKEILNTLKLVDGDNFDLKKIKIVRNKKIWKTPKEEIEDYMGYAKEIRKCRSKKILRIENEIQIIKREIIEYRYPIRVMFDKIYSPLELCFLMLFLKILLALHKQNKRKKEIKEYTDANPDKGSFCFK